MPNRLKNDAGMTLIEILIVLTIIGGVMGMFVVNLVGGQDQANIDQTAIKIKQIQDGLKAFKADAGFYPTSDQGLDALVEKPSSGKVPKRYRPDGYLEELPKDSWDNDFSYAYPSTHGGKGPDIWSNGPDGEEDTEDDIVSWKKAEDEG
jgi:general secretion pathway protein G